MTPQTAPAYVEPQLDEKVWNAWLKKGHLLDQADERRNKLIAGVFLVLLVTAGLFTWFVPR